MLLSGLLVVGALMVTARHQWAGDLRLHIAAVHELMRHPWDPLDPLVGADRGSPYYSPYMVVLAWTAKIADLAPRTVLEIGGILGLVLFTWALRRFCRHISPSPAVPALALLFTLLLWGPSQDVIWSGFFGLHSLSWNLGYPSTPAFGLLLLTWDAYLRLRDRQAGWRPPATLAVLLALVILIHPFTGVNALIGIVAFAIADPRSARKARPLAALLGCVGGVVACLAWPLSDASSLPAVSGGLDAIHRPLVEGLAGYGGVRRYGLVALAVPALIAWRRRPMGRELGGLFLLSTGLLLMAALIGSYGLGRVIPLAVFSVHLALAAWAYERLRSWTVRSVATIVVLALACLMGLYGQQGALIRAYWGETEGPIAEWGRNEASPPARPLMSAVAPAQVVMTEDEPVARLVNERGAFSVIPGWPYPYVDQAGRTRDAATFYAADTTPAERLVIVRRYGISCVVAADRRAILTPGALPGFQEVARTDRGAFVLLCRR